MLRIACLFFYSVIVTGQTVSNWSYPSYCAPKNQVVADVQAQGDGRIPPLPTLPVTFQVRVEANILDKKYSIAAEEYYDASNGFAAFHLFENNSMTYMIFDYNTNQSIYYSNDMCIVHNLYLDDNNQIFGLHKIVTSTASGFHSVTLKENLQFAKSNGLLYKGTKILRGIKCDWWQSCMYWPDLKSNFTLDYYFSAYSNSDWASPDISKQVPVQAEIKGINQGMPFHHLYEYFDFRKSLWKGNEVFETPPGVVCPGRVKTKQVPTLPEQFSFSEEIVDSDGNRVTVADIYYDHTLKLVRFDYVPPFSSAPYYTETSRVTEIQDFNTGITYGTDTLKGNCSMFPIKNQTFDAYVNDRGSAGDQSFFLRMKGPQELFFLDNTSYTYVGTRMTRDILCDVFISNRIDFKLPSYPSFNSTFEIHFMSDLWVTSSSSESSVRIPVQLRISTPPFVGYDAVYNIYNFVAEDLHVDKFQISTCFDASSKKSFKIEFPGSWDTDDLEPYRHEIILSNIGTAALAANVSPLRIQNGQLFIYPDKLYFVATLLERPPNLAYFQHIPGDYSINGADSITSSAEDCATNCKRVAGQCNSFYYCPGMRCVLKKEYSTEFPPAFDSHINCAKYVSVVHGNHKAQTLETAWRDLKDNVISGNYRVNVTQETIITAVSIDDNIVQNPKRTLSTKALMDKFNVQRNKYIPGYDDWIFTGLSIDDCALKCLETQIRVCNAFTYSFDTGYCVLSTLLPDEHPNAVKNINLCDLYTKKYSVDYQKVPGVTILSSSDVIYQNTYTADQCAKLCSMYDEFSCKSFDYCANISMCYLGRTHYYDIPKADVQLSPMCTHYSRNYLSDFKIGDRQKLSATDVRVVTGVSVTQCAKLCVEETIDCASFGYCGNLSECMLSTASMRNAGQVISQPNLWCDVYIRQTFPDGTPYTPKSASCVSPSPSTSASVTPGATTKEVTDVTSYWINSTQDSTTGYREMTSSQNPSTNKPLKYSDHKSTSDKGLSGGAIAGLSLGMVAVGILLAILALFGFGKLRNKASSDLTVAFMKQENVAFEN